MCSNGHKVLSSDMVDWLNRCIEESNVEEFVRNVLGASDTSRTYSSFYMTVLHQCVTLTIKGDKHYVQSILSRQEGNIQVSVYDITSSMDEAYTWLLLENNHNGWVEKYQNIDLKKKTLGKWTSRSDTNGKASYGSSGWSQDGILFFNKAQKFFKKVREHEDFKQLREKAITFHASDMGASYEAGKKRKRNDEMDKVEAPSYAEWV